MNCPKCGNPVAARRVNCDVCGCDLTVYRRIIRLSNGYYNRGLEKARVRDLTGAVALLRKSLEMNKRNIDARNLLGLVYFEMGEAVSALSEWIISKNFMQEGNEADYFMEKFQLNPTRIDAMNQAVKKYNIALDAARQGNDDLAVIQLKKVVSLYPNFIRSLLLLSLIYIRNNDFDRAKRYLKRVLCIDVANTDALSYLNEINRITMGGNTGTAPYWSDGAVSSGHADGKPLMPVTSYKEDKPNVMVFINLLIGVLIGIAVVYYLIVPTIEDNIKEEYNNRKVDYSAELSSKSATITQQEKTITSLTKKLGDTEKLLKEAENKPDAVTGEDYDEIFNVLVKYDELKSKEYTDDELQELALMLWSVPIYETKEYNANAVKLLQMMRDEIYPLAEEKIYKSGRSLYDSGDYEQASYMLKAAVDFDKKSDSAMYYLGKSYQALQKYEDAIYYYKLMLEVCPNSALKQYIPQRLKECGETEE